MSETYNLTFQFYEAFLDKSFETALDLVPLFTKSPIRGETEFTEIGSMIISTSYEEFAAPLLLNGAQNNLNSSKSLKRPNFGATKPRNHNKMSVSAPNFAASLINSGMQASVNTSAPAATFQTFTSEDGKKIFFCDLCSYKSNSRGNMQKHYMLKHSQNCPRYKCSMCDVSVKEKNKLKPHYMKNHGLPETIAYSAMKESQQV